MQLSSILFIIDHLKGGGAERIALDLAEQLQSMGYETYIVSLSSDTSKMNIGQNIPIFYLDISKDFFLDGMWRKRKYQLTTAEKMQIKNTIHQINPDKIILGYWCGYFIEPVIPKQYEVILWFHAQAFDLKQHPKPNLFRKYKEWRRWYFEKKGFLKIAQNKKLIFVNADLKKECEPYLNPKNLFVLYNGINIEKIKEQTQCIGEKKWDCIFVGRLSTEKQPEHAITAFAKSGATGRMAIVGDGELQDNLKHLCQTLNIADSVDFLGWQNNPYSFIVQSKALILSSLYEGFGLVIAEALMMGVPVVAYDLSDGVRYQLSGDRLSQGLVENQNIEKLSQKLGEIIKNPYPIYHQDIEKLSLENMAFNFIQIINESPQD